MKKKKVGIKDIAKFADVSPGTVDRVLHNRGNVSPDSKKRILDAIEELNYKPNKIASILASNKYYKFATFLPDPTEDDFWIQPQEGIIDATRYISDYNTQVDYFYFKEADPAYYLQKGKEILDQGYDGFLFSPSFTREAKILIDYCSEKKTSFVEINTQVDMEKQGFISYIGQDSYGSGMLAGKLLNFGMRSNQYAVIIHLEKEVYNAQHLVDKERGFCDFFAEHAKNNIHVHQATFSEIKNVPKFKCFLEDLFCAYPEIGGVFISTSRANSIVPLLDEMGYLDKIKVVGFDLKEKNLALLKEEKIDFLINQNPHKQGYYGLMTLFNHLVLKKTNHETIQLLPLDVVMKENYIYYLDNQYEVLFV